MAPAPDKIRVPQQSRAIQPRAAIVTAAEREFSENGYAGTTAKTIAKRANIATGSFYQYFKDKDSVLHEIAARRPLNLSDQTVGDIERGMVDEPLQPEQVRNLLQTVVGIVVEYHRQDPGLHGVITERRHVDKALDRDMWTFELRLMDRAEGLLRVLNAGADHKALAFILFATMEGAVHAHVLGTPTVSDKRFVETLAEALMNMVLPRG